MAAGAAAKYLTPETEVQTMRKWQNHHRLMTGVSGSQGHPHPSKNVTGMCKLSVSPEGTSWSSH